MSACKCDSSDIELRKWTQSEGRHSRRPTEAMFKLENLAHFIFHPMLLPSLPSPSQPTNCGHHPRNTMLSIPISMRSTVKIFDLRSA